MTHLLARLREPASPRKLALFRILAGLHVAWIYTSSSWWLLLEIGGKPNRLTGTLLPEAAEAFLDAELVAPAVVVTLIAALLFAAGLFTRISGWILFAGFLATHHFYYRHTHFHDEWPYLWFFLLVMAMAPCARVWSLDARLGLAKEGDEERWLELDEGAPAGWSVRYRWPLEAMIGWFGLIYFAAGISKLLPLRKGVQWLDGPTVHRLVGMRYFDSPVQWVIERPLFDYSLSWPFEWMAWATVVVELSGLALLLSRRAYPLVFAAIIGMHVVIYLLGVPGFLVTALIAGALLVPDAWIDRMRNVEPLGSGTVHHARARGSSVSRPNAPSSRSIPRWDRTASDRPGAPST